MKKEEFAQYADTVRELLGNDKIDVLVPSTEVGSSLTKETVERLDSIINSIFKLVGDGKLKYGQKRTFADVQKMFKDLKHGSSVADAIKPIDIANASKRLWALVHDGKLKFVEKKSFNIYIGSENNTCYLYVGKFDDKLYAPKDYAPFDFEKALKALCRKANTNGYSDDTVKKILARVSASGWSVEEN